jgi:hypothetical protein
MCTLAGEKRLDFQNSQEKNKEIMVIKGLKMD